MSNIPPKEQDDIIEDPDLFMALDDLELVAKGIVEGALNGIHRSKFVGFSNEFESHRDYQIGDDLKHINWNLWANTDKLFIKQYESDTNLNLYLFLDQSASMLTNSAGCSKWNYAARAVAALSYLAMKNRDASGLFLLEEELQNFILPAVKTGHFQDLIAMLQQSEVKGEFKVSSMMEKLVPLCRRKGIVILFSDLFDKKEVLLHQMEHLKLEGHEVLIFQILDPIEISLPESGEYEFVDLESGKTIKTAVEELRDSYQFALSKWRDDFSVQCKKIGVDWITVSTKDPLKDVIIAYLNKRINLH